MLLWSRAGYLGFHPYYNSYIMAEEKQGVIFMFNVGGLLSRECPPYVHVNPLVHHAPTTRQHSITLGASLKQHCIMLLSWPNWRQLCCIVEPASMLEDTAEWAQVEWDLGTPDHYAVSPYGPNLYIGYIAEGKVRLVTMEGEVLEVRGTGVIAQQVCACTLVMQVMHWP
eukprot:366552-Chlamydomonas_euryale.AAC.7